MCSETVVSISILAPTTLYQAAWHSLLANQPGLAVLATASDLSQLSTWPKFIQPATFLIDLPTVAPDFIQQLQQTTPGYGMLVLVDTYDLAHILPLLQAGVGGFVSRDASTGDLVRALIAVGRGEIVLPPPLAAEALTRLARGMNVPERPSPTLSSREFEVVKLLAQGLTNKDIAQTLILSVRTVEAHLRSIYGKLDVTSRTEAALWAVKNGYGVKD